MDPGATLVTGGTGTLGRLVVGGLRSAGHAVTVSSRRPRGMPGLGSVKWVAADLRTGQGLDEALEGVGTVVHCATSNTSADAELGRHLVAAAQRRGDVHLVYISIVGVDRIDYGYYRAKLATEQLLQTSGLRWTVLRATQFHELISRACTVLARLPVMAVPAATSFQPVAAAEVADRLVTLAGGPPAGRVPDLGGPEVLSSRELAVLHLQARRQRRLVVPLALPGPVFAGYRRGHHLAPQDPAGRLTFSRWLGHHDADDD